MHPPLNLPSPQSEHGGANDAQRAEKITQGVNSSWNEDLIEKKDALFCIVFLY